MSGDDDTDDDSDDDGDGNGDYVDVREPHLAQVS